MKIKRCKVKDCQIQVTPPGIAHCAYHRSLRRKHQKTYYSTHPDARTKRNRANALCNRTLMTPKAIAYRERHKITRSIASATWSAKHPIERERQQRLAADIAAGRITKPTCCDSCGKRKKPIVAWRDEDGQISGDWYCWRCWWERRRAARQASPGR